MLGGDFVIVYQTENIGKSYEYRSSSHKNWIVPSHIHEYSEIAFTKEGETCVYLDEKRYIVPKNHLIYIMPNQIHEYSDETSSFMRCAVFSNDFNPLFNSLTFGKELVSPVIDFSDHISLLEELDNMDKSDTMRLCGLINMICSVVLAKGTWSPTHSLMHGRNGLRQVIEYISIHFREDIKLCDLAKMLGYHEKYLSSALHSLTKMNFRKFIASYRVNYAKSLLVSNNNYKSISEIAMESGFSSINAFNKVFLELTGVTPSQFRKEKTKSEKIN